MLWMIYSEPNSRVAQHSVAGAIWCANNLQSAWIIDNATGKAEVCMGNLYKLHIAVSQGFGRVFVVWVVLNTAMLNHDHMIAK